LRSPDMLLVLVVLLDEFGLILTLACCALE
jgi:hypothetical protein